MDDPFFLPPEIREVLPLPAKVYYIDQGHYPLLDDGHFLTVSLRLQSAVQVISALSLGDFPTGPGVRSQQPNAAPKRPTTTTTNLILP